MQDTGTRSFLAGGAQRSPSVHLLMQSSGGSWDDDESEATRSSGHSPSRPDTLPRYPGRAAGHPDTSPPLRTLSKPSGRAAPCPACRSATSSPRASAARIRSRPCRTDISASELVPVASRGALKGAERTRREPAIAMRTRQYRGTLSSMCSDQASIPPWSEATRVQPSFSRIAAAERLRTP